MAGMYRHPAQPEGIPSAANVAVAACAVDLGDHAPTELRLTPAGRFRARDGRPAEVPAGWYIDADIAARVIARARASADDPVIDYEHQTLYTRENGQPAPAAGWWSAAGMQWREDGLYATGVRWTDRAKAAIAAGEYRYISPVLAYDKDSGEVLAVIMAALTNYAAVEGLEDLAALAAVHFLPDHAPNKEDSVDREQLIQLLGLAKDATDEQIQAALTALKGKADQADGLEAQIAALNAKPAGEPDPNKYVPVGVVTELQTQIAALKTRQDNGEKDRLIQQGLDEGKIVGEEHEKWARTLDVAALKSMLATAPAVAALKGTQTSGKPPAGADNPDGELSAEQIAVCKALGISQEDYKASLKEGA